MSEEHGVERVKWFTLARRFPQLIGRTPDGTRIPGGPYTVTQALGGLAVVVVGYMSMGVWAHFGGLGNFAVLFAVAGGTVFGLGRIPLGARNPFAIGVGVVRAVSAPKLGRVRGRSVRIRRPHTVTHRMIVCTPALPAAVAEPVADAVVSAQTASGPVGVSVGAVVPPVATAVPDSTPVPAPVPAPVPKAVVSAAPVPAAAAAAAREDGVIRAPRRPHRATRRATPTSPTQLTGVQALLATVGANPEGD